MNAERGNNIKSIEYGGDAQWWDLSCYFHDSAQIKDTTRFATSAIEK